MHMRNNRLIGPVALFLFLISGLLNAQNWQAVNSGFKYNFTSEADEGVVYTIFTDSAAFDGQDSTLWLNRVVKDNKAGPVQYGVYEQAFYNQPQFLMEEVLINDSATVFMHPEAFVLPINVPESGQWTFDELNGITATLQYEADTTFFGITDSIRVIELSTGDMVILSKNNGILRFDPIYEDNNYHLAGIEDLAGQQVMDYSDIFDYQPGDVFEYESGSADPGGSRGQYTRITILERNDDPPKISYDVLRQISKWNDWGYWNGTIVEERITSVINLDYNYLPGNIENGYHGKFVEMYDNERDYFNFSRIIVDHSYKGLLTKTAGSTEKVDFFMITDSTERLLERNFSYIGGEYTVTRVFVDGLGMVRHEIHDFEYDYGWDLVAYLKNGKQSGTFKNNDIYLSAVGHEYITPVSIYPNPCADFLHLRLPDGVPPDRISVMDLTGKILMWAEDVTAVDVSQLPAGIYLVNIEAGDQRFTRKIVKE